MVGLEDLLQVPDVLERFAGDQLARGVDRLAPLLLAPHPQGVEVLQGQAQRVHPRVAGVAERLVAVDLPATSRRVGSWSWNVLLAFFQRAGCRPAAGGAGVPRMLSRMNRPRFTGEVRVGFDVTTSTEPLREQAAARAVLRAA